MIGAVGGDEVTRSDMGLPTGVASGTPASGAASMDGLLLDGVS